MDANTKAAAETTYTRNFAGFWRRNGKPVKSVPAHVEKLASRMVVECRITVPAK